MDSPDGYRHFIRKNERWNFVVNAGDLSALHLANSFVFTTTILPLYASYLTESEVLIGIIPAILQVGFLLPQIFTARKALTLAKKKPYVVAVSSMERLPYLFIALSILLFPDAPHWFAYCMLAFNLLLSRGSGGLAAPAWKAMLAKVIHRDKRGMMFGLGMSIGSGLGIGGTLAARYILDTLSFPVSFGLCFLFAFVFKTVSFTFLALNREPEKKPEFDIPLGRDYFRKLPALLKENKNFTRYLVSQTFLILGTMGVGFYVVYGKRVFGISDQFAATLTLVSLLSQTFGIWVIGKIGDKAGHKVATQLVSLLGIGSLLLVLLIQSGVWLVPVFILMSLSFFGLQVTRNTITMEFCHEDELPTFVALSSTILGIPTLLAPIIGGWIIESFGYLPMFLSALGITVAGMVIMHYGVTDPRKNRKSALAGGK